MPDQFLDNNYTSVAVAIEHVATAINNLAKVLTPKPEPTLRFGWKAGLVQQKKVIRHMPLALTITDEQKINVKLNPVSPSGRPAKLDGKPQWTVDGLSTILVADDGMSADLISEDTPGVTDYQVSADADLGAGVTTIIDTISLNVVDAQASSLGLTASDPVDKNPITTKKK